MSNEILSRTILVVDDDPKVILFINGIFTPRGYQVLTATNGDEGWKLVEELYEDTDLVLLDLRMPGIDGVDVLKKIKQKYPKMAVGILTAYEERQKDCLENGADFFVSKPYSLRELYDRIENIIKKKEHLKKEEPEIEIRPDYIPTAKVLVVDDEEEICELIKERLEGGVEISLGEYKVETAFDGQTGIKKAREFEPDIIVVDIKMPHLRGDELITIIEKEGPRPKDYLILTAVDSEEDKRKIRRSGYPYVSKPFSEDKFCQDLRKLCFKHGLTRKL